MSSISHVRPAVAAAATALFATLAFAPAANAVPCGNLMSGGVVFSIGCQNGPDGDLAASAADLNSGNFFGFNTWQLLDNTRDGVDSAFWSFVGGNPHGSHMGIGSLATGIWNSFSSLSIVLDGPGGAMDRDVKWAAYQMNPGDQWFAWTYDYLHKLGNAKLFGIARAVSNTAVPEPAALALITLGLVGGAFALQRRRRLQPTR